MVNQHILKKLLQLFVALYSFLHIYIHITGHSAENFPRMSRLERDAFDSHSPLGMRT